MQALQKTSKQTSTRMGFEPTRAEHIGLAVQRLNHSATSSWMAVHLLAMYRAVQIYFNKTTAAAPLSFSTEIFSAFFQRRVYPNDMSQPND